MSHARNWDAMSRDEQAVRSAAMQKVLRFNDWYRRDGHWIYPSREAVLDQWLWRGINGLPDPSPEENAVIQEWRESR